MGSPNIKDLLTSFSPSLDYFAISLGDGRIKIWDTLKGQLQTEFADLSSNDDLGLYNKSENWHLSLDYTCMEWLSLERKRKKKSGYSLLLLGTGSGDVLALDVSAGQLKWRVSDCHPGGVNAISFSVQDSCIYTAGVDGMVSQIEALTGNQLRKFRASTKAISTMSISSDGKILATAAAQLKIFNISDNNKIQKFSGHPGPVRCMIFTENGKYILSSAVGERYVAIWSVDGSKKQSSSCVLAMENPAVFLDGKSMDNGGTDDGLYVVAISEMGLCYFWYGRNIEELRNTKPTKISLSSEVHLNSHKGPLPAIFAAKFQSIIKPASGQVLLACGSVIKPSFEKITVQHGIDMTLSSSKDGVLLPIDQSPKSKKLQDIQTKVTALDRANAEDALLPMAKLYDSHGKKRKHRISSIDPDEVKADDLVNMNQPKLMTNKGEDESEVDTVPICMEDRLRSLGILSNENELNRDSYSHIFSSLSLNHSLFEENIPQKKIKAAILSMTPNDAYKLLTVLVGMWKSRSGSGKYILPWICGILVNHCRCVIAQEPVTQMLDSLHKMTESKGVAIQPLLQLSGRLQLITAQIDKSLQTGTQTLSNNLQFEESEDEDDDVDELVYGEEEEDESLMGSDDAVDS